VIALVCATNARHLCLVSILTCTLWGRDQRLHEGGQTLLTETLLTKQLFEQRFCPAPVLADSLFNNLDYKVEGLNRVALNL
jgi:hypothetical protein